MNSILITPAAENDLINIWLYIARDSSESADRVYRATENTFQTLAATPRMGTKYRSRRAQLEGLRFFPVTNFNHVVYYREHPQGIEIIRVLHAHMNKQKHISA